VTLVTNDTQIKIRPCIGETSGAAPNQHEDSTFAHLLAKIYGSINELLIR